MINKVLLIGFLGQDPDVVVLESGASVGKLSLATNESYLDKNDEWQTITEWHRVVVWRKLAERAEKTLQKGMQVYVEGKLTTRKYQKKNGEDAYTTEVVANTFRILGKRENSGSGFPEEAPEAKTRAEQRLEKELGGVKTPEGGIDGEKADDLPF